MRRLILLVLTFSLCVPLTAQDTPHAFVGGTLYPIDQSPIEDGVLVVHEGRIVDLGPQGSVEVPDEAVR
ncbi:MAG: amidohydrolase, partial [Bacteroidetes bacterium]|nr:amidohydrolase [Bacteroidota bacterium]